MNIVYICAKTLYNPYDFKDPSILIPVLLMILRSSVTPYYRGSIFSI